jgi:ubiquinone biosynthesis protein
LKPFFTKHYRHFQRYNEIIRVISTHGFGYLLELSGIHNVMRWPFRHKKIPDSPRSIAERLRMMLAELGPTFIKLGQILSTRPDLLPAIYISQLERLQDQVLPVDFSEIKQTLEAELGQPWEQIFKKFNSMPLASASIGQVHEAILLSGERVAVKVQRAGILKRIETDLEIMYDVAGFLEMRTDWGKLYKIQDFITEFDRTIRDELDYIIEAKNAERFYQNFRDDPGILIPKVHWKWTSKRVLVLDYVTGWKITAIADLEQNGIQKSDIASKLAKIFFKQILIDGFFHADPHPGNIMVANGGIIILMDFGMVGRLDGWLKERLVRIMLSILRRDVNSLLMVLNEFSEKPFPDGQHLLKRELYYLMDRYENRPLKDIELSTVLRELMELSSRYRIRPPQELAIIARCLVLLDNIITLLDPDTSLLELAKPFAPRLVLEKFTPENMKRVLLEYLLDLTTVMTTLPGKTNQLLQQATDGELKLKIEQHHFDLLISKLMIVGNRLSSSIIIAGTIIGSSLIALKASSSLFGRFPIADIGFLTALVMGMWLLISMIRSGRI